MSKPNDNPKTQQKIEEVIVAVRAELERQIENTETGHVLITAGLNVHQKGIRSVEIQGNVKYTI